MANEFAAVILMGVSGCGKTTVGKLVADRLGWTFIESDEYHSSEDIKKMAGGIPLTDSDRWPWLNRLHNLLKKYSKENRPVVLACSALKQSYRDLLSTGVQNVHFVFLKGNYELIFERMQNRQHYMKAGMLKSQFDALEEPEDALVITIELPPAEIVSRIIEQLNLAQKTG